MIKFVRLAALAAVATVVATPAAAQVAATPKATARVNVVKPLTLAVEQNLNFGTVIVTGDSTVTVTPAGACGSSSVASVTMTVSSAPMIRERTDSATVRQKVSSS